MDSSNMALYMVERRKKRRSKLIELAGSKCIRCGSTEELNFDHRDAKTKALTLSGKGIDGPWAKILEELEKCDLLCRPCHLEKTAEAGDNTGGGWNKGISKYGDTIGEHGHYLTYMNGCRCDECRTAKHNYRVQIGEISGKHGQYKKN